MLSLKTSRYAVLRTVGSTLAIIGAIPSAPHLALADDFLFSPWEEHSENAETLRATPRFFSYWTTSNFGPEGAAFIPPYLDHVHRLQGDLSLRFAPIDRLTLFAKLSWIRQEVVTTASVSALAYGLADQTIGTYFKLLRSSSGAQLGLQAQFGFPLYNNTSAAAANQPFIGDGSMDVTAGPHFSIPVKTTDRGAWILRAGAGFSWRSANFSMSMPWSSSIEHEPRSRGLVAKLSLDGVFSLRTDPNGQGTWNPQNDVGGVGASGSYLVNAINPSSFHIRGTAGYQFDPRFSVLIWGGRPLWGQDIPLGISFGGMLQVRLGSGVATSSASSSPTITSQKDGFTRYLADALVTESNAVLSLIKINKGSADGIQMGQRFDFFPSTTSGLSDEVIAQGQVTQLMNNEAVVKIQIFTKEVWIEPGFIARSPAP